jgi:uncharacterized protein YdbL (DUF1318 family)
VSTRAPEAPAKGSGLVLLTLAAGQFLMSLGSSVMNVSIATVAKDVGTTVTGVLLWVEHQMQNLAIVLDSCQSRCQSTSQHQTGLWRSGWIWHLT